MICTQLKVYVVFYILQFILATLVLGQKPTRDNIISGLIVAGVIYLLCKFKFKLVANLVVGLLIGIAVLGDISILREPSIIKTLGIEQAGVKKGVNMGIMNT